MQIDYLFNHPEKVEDVSKMVYEEFVLNSDSDKSFSDVINFFTNTYLDKLPVTLVALEKDKCIGMVSIFENDLKERLELKPWLASLYIEPQYRGRGIGRQMVERTIEGASMMGYEELYLRTEDAVDYYRKMGWKHIETLTVNDETVDVFKQILHRV